MPDVSLAEFTVGRQSKGLIDPLWFGHNLEHTRSCIWRGMSAQMIRNRKFFGKPNRTGQAMEWYPIGPRETLFTLRGLFGYYEAGDTYTRHHDNKHRSRTNELLSQYVTGHKDGAQSGIGQDGLVLQGGRSYEFRVVIKPDRPMPVTVRIVGSDGTRVCHETVVQGQAGQWQRHQFMFTAPCGELDARVEITFEGIGDLAIGAVSLLPADNFLGMRSDVVELLGQMGVTLLRWPGGNFAGDYRWQDGLMDVDQRGPLQSFMPIETLPHCGGYDNHEIGTDEFIALCRRLGAEPYISINIAWDSPADAAAWVEYCNGSAQTPWGQKRAQRGHVEPYNVKFWSLGNELGYGHMEGPNKASTYAQYAVQCAQAMREADPSIQFVSSGLWGNDEWISDCLPHIIGVVQHGALHIYQGLMKEFVGDKWAAEYARLLNEPANAFGEIAGVRSKLNAAGGQSLGIAFDEWNVWYAWYRTPGVAEGMYVACMLDQICKRAREVGMSLGGYFEPVNEGAIIVEPTSARLTPGGDAFCLYTDHHGNELLDVTGAPGSDVAAVTVSRDGSELVATIINKHPENDRPVRLNLPSGDWSIKENVLLVGEDMLPGSVFRRQEAQVTRPGGAAVEVKMPRFSIARLRIAPK